MSRTPNRKLVLGATGLLALGGAGGAIAATQGSSSPRKAFVNDVAHRLNVSPSQLTAAMTAAMNDRINAELAAGKLTAAQAQTLRQRAQQTGGLPFFGRGFHRGGLGGRLGVAATYLGITEAKLHADLQSGKSLADIAAATPGKSAAGLKDALLAAARTRLDKAVKMGWLTSAQEQTRLAGLGPRIDKLIARKGLPMGHAMRHP